MFRWMPLLAAGCATAMADSPPPIPDLPHGQCENGATGADGYFLGRFTIADGKVHIEGAPEMSRSLREIAEIAYGEPARLPSQ